MHRGPDGLRVLRARTGLACRLQAVGTRSARGVIKHYDPAFISMGDGDIVMTDKEMVAEINGLTGERVKSLKDLLAIRGRLIDN